MCAVAVAVAPGQVETERRAREGPYCHEYQEGRECLRVNSAAAAWIVVGKRGSRGSGDTANAGADRREDRSHV